MMRRGYGYGADDVVIEADEAVSALAQEISNEKPAADELAAAKDQRRAERRRERRIELVLAAVGGFFLAQILG